MPCCSRHTKVSSLAPPRWVLDDPVNLSRFQWLLKDYVFGPHGNIDLEVSPWTNTVQTAQRHAFPVPPVRPRKPWLSHHSWSLIRHTAQCRSCVDGTGLACSLQMSGFSLWRLSITCSQPTVRDSLISHTLALWHHAHLNRALCDWNVRSLTLLKDKCPRSDRQLSLEQFAHRAARAAACSDYLTTLKIVKSLAGVSPTPLQSVSAQDGTEADCFRERWRQHHADVLLARIDGSKALGQDTISLFARGSWVCRRASPRIVTWNTCVTFVS